MQTKTLINTMKNYARRLATLSGGKHETACLVEVTWKPGNKFDVSFGASVGRRTQDNRIFALENTLTNAILAVEERLAKHV